MQEEKVALEDVVVTGIFTRKKESFTGSASTYTAAELKTMGSQNILQSLMRMAIPSKPKKKPMRATPRKTNLIAAQSIFTMPFYQKKTAMENR